MQTTILVGNIIAACISAQREPKDLAITNSWDHLHITIVSMFMSKNKNFEYVAIRTITSKPKII